jgi:SAM-dependent methyltransferase
MVKYGMEEIACDNCGSTDADPVYRLADFLCKVPGEFVLRRCRQCGLMYLSPRPTSDEIGRYYPASYFAHRTAIEDERWGLMRYMRRQKLIQRRRLVEHYSGLGSGRILDVGCATGLFLHEMDLAGWQAAGVELDVDAAGYARRRFGLNVVCGQLRDAPWPADSFDVVTFFGVLEHTYSPGQELRSAARLLRPGGLLVMNIPNWRSLDRRLFGRFWMGLDAPRHLYVFTQSVLTGLLEHAGFSVITWRCVMTGYFDTVLSVQAVLDSKNPFLAGPAKRLLNFPGMRLVFEPWFIALDWLGVGPNLTVFARRA